MLQAVKKSEQDPRKAVELDAAELRGSGHLAGLQVKESNTLEGDRHLDAVLASMPRAHDPAEELRRQVMARKALVGVEKHPR